MNNEYNKYLPIGSVVLLKEAKKKLMITGFCTVSKKEENKIYDYSGCLYPEGLLTSNSVCLFNHEQIEKICHLGLIDEEEQKFKTNLNDLMKKVNEKLIEKQNNN